MPRRTVNAKWQLALELVVTRVDATGAALVVGRSRLAALVVGRSRLAALVVGRSRLAALVVGTGSILLEDADDTAEVESPYAS